MKNGRTNWGAIAGVAIAIVLTLAFLGWIASSNTHNVDSISGITPPQDIVDYITNGAVFLGSMVGV